MTVDTFAFPASFAQQRLWFINQLEPTSSLYNVPLTLGLSGDLDVLALERSLATIVRRHEALRTTFTIVDGEPVQVVRDVALELPILDLEATETPAREAEVQRVIRSEVARPFDLERGPLFRATLLRVARDEHVLLLAIHHIVFDGWSAGIFFRELSVCYRAFASGDTPQLPELPVQYGDFAVWQRAALKGDVLERHLTYWRAQLTGAPVLQLPTDFAPLHPKTYRGSATHLLLPPSLLQELQALSQREGATLFMTLLAAFQILLARHSGQKDIVVGTPVANRTRSELEDLIGFFVNPLPLRTDLSGNPTFRELLRRVREVALDAYAHQDLPFERLVQELKLERVQNRNPVFQVMFALQNAPRSSFKLPGLTLRSLPRKGGTSKFDLTLSAREDSSGLRIRLEYSTELFESDTIRRMLGQYHTLLQGIVAEPDRHISALPLIASEERQQVLVEWNRTDRVYPSGCCVHELFEREAAEHPQTIAVEAGDIRLTYGELDRNADRLAHYLKRFGVGPDVCVGVALERSPEMVMAFLAVLKAGGAYVPLDPHYPPERLALMLDDARVGLLVTTGQTKFPGIADRMAVVNLETERERVGLESDQKLESGAATEHLAYVMFTSGSTGRPKGIAVPHRAIVRLIRNTDYVQMTAEDRVAQISNASFDGATFEIWGALLNGGRLVLIDRDVVLSAVAFAAEIRERGITAMFLTTALLNQLARAVPGVFGTVRHLLFGGEAVDPRAVREVLAHGPPERLLHVYGPTETTTFATWYEVRELPETARTVPIGRPISNTRAYVLDEHLMPVAVGVPGELYLGGPGLARGYLGRAGLTADRFMPDPFSTEHGEETGGRLYRTGDRVRWRPDGTLEFLGRFDEQIKLRGFRIEPGEIEVALARHPAVRECAVVVRDDLPGGRALVAYLAARASNGTRQPPLTSLLPDVRAYLRQRLPEYMIPSAFVVLDALPLSPNGKVARRLLPAPDGMMVEPQGSFIPPRTRIEKALAELWQELLGVDRVGIEESFFDLGGHSLLALRLFAEIERTFDRRLPLSTLFQAPTISKLAEILAGPAPSQQDDESVVLQAGGIGPPLFVVHEADGRLMRYRELVDRLGPDLPVYGFELTSRQNGEPVLTTFEELAAKYVHQMRARQPTGPYFLCGYCWAGQLTFEMACQLRAAGQDVGLLAVIDSRCPGPRPAPYHRRLGRLAKRTRKLVTQNLRRLAALELDAIPGFLRKRAENITVRLFGTVAYRWSLRLRRPVLPLLRDVSTALAQAARCYRPPLYPGAVTVFRARPPDAPPPPGEALGWGRVARGGIDLHEVPGEHLSIMTAPQVEELARQLRVCLQRARASSS